MYATITGCATTHQVQSAAITAHLKFANQVDKAHGLPGSFISIDGKRLSGFPGEIEVSAGKHEIGYSCPNTVPLHFLPTAQATFLQGADYILDCSARWPDVIKQR